MGPYVCYDINSRIVIFCEYYDFPSDAIILKSKAVQEDQNLVIAWNCVSTDQQTLSRIFIAMKEVGPDYIVFNDNVNTYEWRLKIALCREVSDWDLVRRLMHIRDFIK